MAIPLLTGADFNGQRAVNAADGVNPSDLVTKAQLDAMANGQSWKLPVRAASTANLTLSGLQTVDGISLIANDRVLAKDQTTGSANGIYLVASGAWTRASDADTAAKLKAATVYVTEGSANADKAFNQSADNVTLGTTSLVWAQTGGGSLPTAGAGLTLTGSTLDVGAGTGISVATDSIAIDTSVVARKYSTAIGDGSATSIAVTHNLGTKDVSVSIRRVSDDAFVLADPVATSVNVVTVSFTSAPASGAYRVVVVG